MKPSHNGTTPVKTSGHNANHMAVLVMPQNTISQGMPPVNWSAIAFSRARRLWLIISICLDTLRLNPE